MNEADAQLPLKKRARRRLVGAIALAALAAVVLPMVMDQAPQSPVADVQIRIPGQEQAPPFNPKAKPAEAPRTSVPAVAQATGQAPAKAEAAAPVAAPMKPESVVKPTDISADKTAEKPAAKPTEKPTEKSTEKSTEKQVEKTKDKPAAKPSDDDSRRAAALLAGKAPEPAANGQFVILIGAFANPANVKQLQTKLGEIGVKTFTEPLDSPQGNKTRVRAGPFPNRDTAEKALDKMKRIGVNGIVTAKQ